MDPSPANNPRPRYIDPRRFRFGDEQAQQIAAGGHGGLGPAELAEYRHGQERIAEMFETAALTLRRGALQRAVDVIGGQGDPAAVLDAARKFEAFLKGESATERG